MSLKMISTSLVSSVRSAQCAASSLKLVNLVLGDHVPNQKPAENLDSLNYASDDEDSDMELDGSTSQVLPKHKHQHHKR